MHFSYEARANNLNSRHSEIPHLYIDVRSLRYHALPREARRLPPIVEQINSHVKNRNVLGTAIDLRLCIGKVPSWVVTAGQTCYRGSPHPVT